MGAAIALTALAYDLILFTDSLNPYLRSSYRAAVLTYAVAVLAIFSCVEVMRTERSTPIRAVAGAVAAPLVLVILLSVWYGLRSSW